MATFEKPVATTTSAPVVDGGAGGPRNPWASGWVPQSPLVWLEELRDEHERLVSAFSLAAKQVVRVRDSQVALRSEHDERVAEAARASGEPPILPGRLDPAYMHEQLQVAEEAKEEARDQLARLIERVGSAVGAHRLGDGWLELTGVDDEAAVDDPRRPLAARLRVFERQWVWPPVWEPGPTLQELNADVEAATVECQRLEGEAQAKLAAWERDVAAAYAAKAPRPGAPDLETDGSLMARSHARTRLERAITVRDRAVLLGRTS